MEEEKGGHARRQSVVGELPTFNPLSEKKSFHMKRKKSFLDRRARGGSRQASGRLRMDRKQSFAVKQRAKPASAPSLDAEISQSQEANWVEDSVTTGQIARQAELDQLTAQLRQEEIDAGNKSEIEALQSKANLLRLQLKSKAAVRLNDRNNHIALLTRLKHDAGARRLREVLSRLKLRKISKFFDEWVWYTSQQLVVHMHNRSTRNWRKLYIRFQFARQMYGYSLLRAPSTDGGLLRVWNLSEALLLQRRGFRVVYRAVGLLSIAVVRERREFKRMSLHAGAPVLTEYGPGWLVGMPSHGGEASAAAAAAPSQESPAPAPAAVTPLSGDLGDFDAQMAADAADLGEGLEEEADASPADFSNISDAQAVFEVELRSRHFNEAADLSVQHGSSVADASALGVSDGADGEEGGDSPGHLRSQQLAGCRVLCTLDDIVPDLREEIRHGQLLRLLSQVDSVVRKHHRQAQLRAAFTKLQLPFDRELLDLYSANVGSASQEMWDRHGEWSRRLKLTNERIVELRALFVHNKQALELRLGANGCALQEVEAELNAARRSLPYWKAQEERWAKEVKERKSTVSSGTGVADIAFNDDRSEKKGVAATGWFMWQVNPGSATGSS